MRLIIKSLRVLIQDGVPTFLKKIIEWKRNRDFHKYLVRKDWERVLIYCYRLANNHPEKIEYHQRVARCLKELGRDDEATIALEKGFNNISTLNEVMKILEPTLGFGPTVISKYIYMGGDQNYGCIEHTKSINQHVKKYITKISALSSVENEKKFYLEIYKNFPDIHEITPKLLDYTEWSNPKLTLITMEKIEGTSPLINKKIIGDVIKASKIIASIRYEKLMDCIPNPNLNDDFHLIFDIYPRHPIKALHSFSSIHLKTTNEQLFELIYKRMGKLKYSLASFKSMERLENVIFQKNLYQKIKPKVHYSLQHGDFQKHNMILDSNGNLFIIDWGNMRVGPRWVDIAGYLGQLKEPFQVVKDEFLLNKDKSDHFELIEKIFFVYTLIVIWFIVFPRREFESKHDQYHGPAIEYMESMIQYILEPGQVLIG